MSYTIRAPRNFPRGDSRSTLPAPLRHGMIGNITREGYRPLCRIVWLALTISIAVPNFTQC